MKPRTHPWTVCTQEDAKPYKKYRVLYGERKYARDFTKEKQTLSFTDDLPAEMRLKVYSHVFQIPGSFFELWAPEKLNWVKNNYRQIARQRPGLSMMRLCKEIRNEVADIFYGGNNFRFSNDRGIVVMAAFFHTIRPDNCNFLRRITVQIPHRQFGVEHNVTLNSGWGELVKVLKRRGMRIPPSVFRANNRRQFELRYDSCVRSCFRQLCHMPNLRRLEITIPWFYEVTFHPVYIGIFFDFQGPPAQCYCSAQEVEAMGPEHRIRHTVHHHSMDPQYWDLLADLKKNTASDDLTIALVIQYGLPPLDEIISGDRALQLRQARWIAAYAALMGYEVGHAWWETEGPGRGSYQVRYDEDPLRAIIPEGEENSLMEPPQLPEQQ